MSDRVRRRDLAFLTSETTAAPRHNATVEIFDPGGSGLDYARLTELVSDRISFLPRYRQRVITVPGNLAAPVWADDGAFDLAYHVRRSALPRPGSMEQLRDLVARIVSRPLDRDRPLWEMYYVEGLAQGRVALLSKTHEALVDGVHTVDMGQLLLDPTPQPRHLEGDDWVPRPRPTAAALLGEAVREGLTSPPALLETGVRVGGTAYHVAEAARRRAGRVVSTVTRRAGERTNAVSGPLSRQRRFVTAEHRLSDYRRIRAAHPGSSVNDVVLTTLTGALRAWLMARTESLDGLTNVRAVVPVSVIDEELEATSLGSQIAAHFVSLPVAEPSPVVRLHQVSYSFQAHKDTGRSVAANRLTGLAGFAPTTFHAIGSRVAAAEMRRGFHLSVTNVPGPQTPLYAAGARMLASYPVPPLTEGHPLAIGVTSYDGAVLWGITADREWVPDADLLAASLTDALDELIDISTGGRPRSPRGRRSGRGRTRTPSRVSRARRAKGNDEA